MAKPATTTRTSASGQDPAAPWAAGLTTFAGVMMIMTGTFQAITGIAAIVENEFMLVTGEYVFQFDVTTWGWIHLLVGALVAFAGYGVLTGQTWARVVGITLAVLSALTTFAFIPYYPFWSIVIIALDVFVIWALSVYRPQPRAS